MRYQLFVKNFRKGLFFIKKYPPARKKSFPTNKTFLMAGLLPNACGLSGLLLGFFLAVTIYSTVYFIIPNVMAGATASIQFRIYGSSLEDFHDVPASYVDPAVVDDEYYRKTDPTVFYFHGFTESPTSESVLTVVAALMAARPRLNVIVVDWSIIAGNAFYPIPAVMTGVVGKRIASHIDIWIRQGKLRPRNIRLVGHSLGAQCAGFVAKTVRKGRVPILVGLDPAYPGFFSKNLHKFHIWHTDADMVTIIHTDGGMYGVPYNTGRADFFPNGGRRFQPGCPTNTKLLSDEDFCSHWRAWKILSESIRGGEFVSLRCDTYENFLAGKCDGNFKTKLDVLSGSKLPNGSYFFMTAEEVPLALGENGIKPPAGNGDVNADTEEGGQVSENATDVEPNMFLDSIIESLARDEAHTLNKSPPTSASTQVGDESSSLDISPTASASTQAGDESSTLDKSTTTSAST